MPQVRLKIGLLRLSSLVFKYPESDLAHLYVCVYICVRVSSSFAPKRGVLVHKNSLASYQRCSHSVKPRALTCPFKQSNLSAWSYPNL